MSTQTVADNKMLKYLDREPEGDPTRSVYNFQGAATTAGDSMLDDLLPDRDDQGWPASRNMQKVLNYLEVLQKKENIARILNLHNIDTDHNLFSTNYHLLARHQNKELRSSDIVRELALTADNQTDRSIRQLLGDLVKTNHIEFHPTDRCNLQCAGCTYHHDVPELKPAPMKYPFDRLDAIRHLQPKSILVIGGGEPTLYKDGDHSFDSLIHGLRETNPKAQLALTSNGTVKPAGSWPNQLHWLRLSLDASSAPVYRTFRGKNLFNKVIRNFLQYLDFDIPYVGLSFLFSRLNIHEYATLAGFIFNLVKKEKPYALHKVNIQYRPLRKDPFSFGNPFSLAVSKQQIDKTVKAVRSLAETSREIKQFLKNQTNITAILGGNTHPPHFFNRCLYSTIFKIVRANGDVRPCFVRIFEPDFSLGNLLTDNLETIALNSLYISAARKTFCDPRSCRQCHLNFLLHKGLNGEVEPSASSDVKNDFMF